MTIEALKNGFQEAKQAPRDENCDTHGPYVSNHIFMHVWSACPVCTADKKATRQREEDEKEAFSRLRAWKQKLGNAGIPERFHARTLDSYIASNTGQRSALAFSREFAEGFAGEKSGRCAIFCGKPGTGKALALDTPIPTPYGWTSMGQIKVGDQVFDETGKICNVTFVTEIQFDRDCYEVLFCDGTIIVADAEHQWETKTHMVRYSKSPPTVRTTLKIKETLKCNHSVPISASLDLPDVILPVDPYVFGVWLGDGDSCRAYLTCVEPVLVEIVRDAGCSLKLVESGIRAQRYSMGQGGGKGGGKGLQDSLQSCLRRNGLLNNKHIPQEYLRGSYKQRLSLLQGLMDTDGYVDSRGSGTCEFTSTIETLSTGVFELITSLGIKATIKESDAKLNGRVTSRKWRITFTPSIPVFRLPRKSEKINLSPRSTTKHRYIVDVRKVATTPVRCIQVDSISHLYLASKAMIPTHNTHLSVGIGLHAMTLNKMVLFTTVQRMVRRVKDSWKKESDESESEAIGLFVQPDLLIIDEIGVQFGSEYEKNLMFDILNERYENSMPSLLLSNLTATEVKAFLGERVFDRLREDGGKCIPFDWQSHRGQE